jgi:hypothetical protein
MCFFEVVFSWKPMADKGFKRIEMMGCHLRYVKPS